MSSDINFGAISEDLNNKADIDLANLPDNYDYVIAMQRPTSTNNYTWYRKYKSGWVEQGGLLGNAGSFATRTITMPVTMVDSNYTVVITGAWTDTTGNGSMLNQNKTTKQFGVYSTNYNNSGSWYVAGMAA